MNYSALLSQLIARQNLSRQDMLGLMRAVMTGELTPAQIAGAIIALRCKGETVTELAAAATVMREFATQVPLADTARLVDTCGTGGDTSHTFNISTAAAFVAAAAGARVAKHGGRSVSSKSGSADVLEALGVNINMPPEEVARCIGQVGLGFMFAPNFHGAMKHAAPVRRELGIRTIFNILGPLTNPAGAPNQVMGVFHPDLVGIQVRVLQRLGANRALTVHGREGLDEISISGETLVGELRDGQVTEYTLHPSQFGMNTHDIAALRVNDVEESRARVLKVLDNQPGPERDIVTLNAGAAVYAAGVVDNLAEGVEKAREAIACGAARAKLAELVAFGRG